MKTIGIVANLNKKNALSQAERIARGIRERGGGVFFETALAAALPHGGTSFSLEAVNEEIDALVVLGGDGTMIRTFRQLDRKEIPLLGINLGGLGFLTEVRLDAAEPALENLLLGKLKVEQRNTLDGCCRRNGAEVEFFTALNEIVIGKGGLARVIHLETFVDSDYLTAYMADGIILATPTGSTAYSLSAQGPIISPETDAFLLNPICSHTLTNRPIILGGDREIRIKLISHPPGTVLTVDGQVGFPLQKGDEVIVRRGKSRLHLLTAPGSSYYAILRSKLNWGGRSHYRRGPRKK
ncbi:MAG: NAD(+)/NADH kinase [PVC group bacterium]